MFEENDYFPFYKLGLDDKYYPLLKHVSVKMNMGIG